MLKKIVLVGAIAILFGGLFIDSAVAQTPISSTPINTGDTAFMLFSAALVLLMTPGLAFFYSGFVRSRNVLNTLMMGFVVMGIVGVTWVLWGYSLAFAPGNAFIGGLQWLGLNGVLLGASEYAPTIPHPVFMTVRSLIL